MSACPSCGHENEPGARFCSACGTALQEAPSTARTERKVVTVLFADLVGFTARAERLDPEDVQALLAPYHANLRSELERFGGTVEKFIGDAVMALFGAPIAHEDDPERAVRVNTGEALINLAARPESGEGMAAGDIVNATARIETAAPANGILVGESTHRATAHTIDYGEPTTIDAKGKDQPIPVWEVREARSRFGVDVGREATTPLVGRTRELDALKAALTRARQQQSPELHRWVTAFTSNWIAVCLGTAVGLVFGIFLVGLVADVVKALFRVGRRAAPEVLAEVEAESLTSEPA